MIKINEDIFQIEDLKSGQSYVLVEDQSITLVDTGMPGDLRKIKKAI